MGKSGIMKKIGILACLAIFLTTILTGCGEDDENDEPVANAGSDITATVGETVVLNGTSSNDPEGDPLSYTWTFLSRPQDSNATLSNPSSPTPSFVVDKEGAYVVNLVVFDGILASEPDSVTVTGIP